MMKVLLYAFGVGVLVCLRAWGAPAQATIQAGAVRLALPSTNWTQKPAAEGKTGQGAEAQALIHAEFKPGGLAAHVTSFEYPAKVSETQLALFVQRLLNQFEKGAYYPAAETTRNWSGFPVLEREFRYPGWKFMTVRLIFCESRAYLVEIGGAGETRKEAELCWGGLSLAGEKALAAGSFDKMIEARRKALPGAPAGLTEKSNARFFAIISALAVAFLGALAASIWAVKAWRSGKIKHALRRLQYGKRRKRSS